MYKIFTAFFAMIVVGIAFATPPDRQPPTPKAIPDIAGKCAWGEIYQWGRSISIEGDAEWTAEGEIRQDGTIRILWRWLDDARAPDAEGFPGVYRLNADGSITGDWGLLEDISEDGQGNLHGLTRTEILREVHPAPPIN
jgi:hypothetical protein